MSEELAQEEIEQKAANLGHVPKDEFRGDPDKWVSAERFLERGEKELPLARANNEKLHKEIAALRADQKETKDTFKEFAEDLKTRNSKAEQKGYDKAVSDLEIKQRKAVDNADIEEYDRIAIEKRQLEDNRAPAYEPQPAPTQGQAQSNPLFESFVANNSWYNEDAELQALAHSMADFVSATKPHLDNTPQFYDEVIQQVKNIRPEKFNNPNRTMDSFVDEGGQRASSKADNHSFASLPAEDKAICDRYIKQGLYKTREEYLAVYHEE